MIDSMRQISKRTFFCFLSLFFSSLNILGQIGVLEMSDAIFLQKENYRLNCIISATSINGNYEVAQQLLSKENPRSRAYRVGNAMLLYNIHGRDNSFQYLDSISKRIPTSKEELTYLKALVSISTNNSDDYWYYRDQIDSTSAYWIRLKFKENDKKSWRDYDKDDKKITVKRIDRILSNAKLPDSDRLFLELKKIDLLRDITYRDSVKYDKVQGVLKLWKKYPQQFDKEELLSSLRRCHSPYCEKAKASLRTKEVLSNEEQVFKLIYEFTYSGNTKTLTTLEQELQNLVDAEPKWDEKERIKAMIISADKNEEYSMSLKSKLKNSLLFEIDRVLVSFSNPFVDGMKTTVSKKELLSLIDTCCGEALVNDAYKQVKQAPKVILQSMLGDVILIRNYSNLLEKSIGRRLKRYVSLTERAPPYEVVEDWDVFIAYLEKKPLFNHIINPRRFDPIPSIKTKEEYSKAKKYIDALFQKQPNNYAVAKWRFWVYFSPQELYELDVTTAESYFKQMIHIYSLNQDDRDPMGEKYRKYGSTGKKWIGNLNKQLSPEKRESIIQYLEKQMKLYPRHRILRRLHVYLMLYNSKYEEYFKSYVEAEKVDIWVGGLDSYAYKYVDKKLGKKLILGLYRSTDNFDRDAYIPACHWYGLFDEAAHIKGSYLSDLPHQPQREEFFTKYFDDLIGYKGGNPKEIQRLLEIVFEKNQDLGILRWYLMMYDLILGNKEKALSRLNVTVDQIPVYCKKELDEVTNWPRRKGVDEHAISSFMEEFEKRFPGYFEKKRLR